MQCVIFLFLFKLFKLSKASVSTAIDKLMKGEEYQASTSPASPFETLWEASELQPMGLKHLGRCSKESTLKFLRVGWENFRNKCLEVLDPNLLHPYKRNNSISSQIPFVVEHNNHLCFCFPFLSFHFFSQPFYFWRAFKLTKPLGWHGPLDLRLVNQW